MTCTLIKCSVYICKTFLDILMMPSHYSIILKCLLPLVRYKEPTSTFLNIMTTDLKLYFKNSGIWFIYTLETQKQHACKKEKRRIVKTLKTSCAHRKWQNTQKQRNINSYSITSASFKRLGVRTCEKMRKNCLIS